MKSSIIFLFALLAIIGSAQAAVWYSGELVTDNVTYTIKPDYASGTIVADNITVYDDHIVINNDNISLSPNDSMNVTINEWTSTHNNFTIEEDREITSSVKIGAINAINYLNGLYVTSPFNASSGDYYRYGLEESISLEFYDEDNLSLLTWATVSIDFISDAYTANLSTSNGTLNTDLPQGEYVARYSAPGYTERNYYLDLTTTQSGTIKLYLLENADSYNITVEVVDQDTRPVSAAVVKLLKFYVSEGGYILQESEVTNNDGEAFMSATFNDEYYRFVVDYDGQTVLTTEKFYITKATYRLQIVIGDYIGQYFYDEGTIDHSLTYDDTTDEFRFVWSDDTGISNTYCLETKRIRITGSTVINKTCISSGTGGIDHSITPVNGSFFQARAYYLDDDGYINLLESLSQEFDDNFDAGTSGLWWQLLLTIGFVLLCVWSPPLLFMGVPASFLLGKIIGINEFSWVVVSVAMVAGIILSLVTANKS